MIKSNKIKKALFGTAIAGMAFAGGFGLAKHNAKAEKEQLKAKVETSFDTQIKLNNNQLAEITAEKDSLHQKTQEIIENIVKEQNDTTVKQIRAFVKKVENSFSKQEKAKIMRELNSCYISPEYKDISDIGFHQIIAVTENCNDNGTLLSMEEEDLRKQSKFLYPELGAKRYKFAREYRKLCKEFIYDDGNEKDFVYSNFMIMYTNDKDADFYSVIIDDIVNYYNSKEVTVDCWDEYHNMLTMRVCHISKEDIAGRVPDFSLVVFKKYKSKIDTICKRLHELDKQEKQLQQVINLKNNIMASGFSR